MLRDERKGGGDLGRAGAKVEAHDAGTALPRFVNDEFDAYLDCGILAHGFLRLTCESCACDTLAAFSCKRCGICPSCGTRRMAETAASRSQRHRTTVPLHHAPGDRQRAAEHQPRRQCGAQTQACPELVEGTPWRNGATHIVLTPMEFMQRLAALVPRPRLHLIRFHGVLAPNAKLRSQVMPTPAPQTTAGEGDCQHAHSAPLRMTWARLLKRVFDIDVERCACGGKLKLIAIIEAPVVIEKILTHLGLSPQPPPRAKARRVDLFGAE